MLHIHVSLNREPKCDFSMSACLMQVRLVLTENEIYMFQRFIFICPVHVRKLFFWSLEFTAGPSPTVSVLLLLSAIFLFLRNNLICFTSNIDYYGMQIVAISRQVYLQHLAFIINTLSQTLQSICTLKRNDSISSFCMKQHVF